MTLDRAVDSVGCSVKCLVSDMRFGNARVLWAEKMKTPPGFRTREISRSAASRPSGARQSSPLKLNMTTSNSPSRNWGILVASDELEAHALRPIGEAPAARREHAFADIRADVPPAQLREMDRRAPAADADVEHVHVVEVANQRPEYGFLGRL